MIILIAGATHTGKTVLSQRLLEQYHYPYLSIDHLKMGLIRENGRNLKQCKAHGCPVILLDEDYHIDLKEFETEHSIEKWNG